ncbi:MAG TPA: hypothetical protein VFX59_17225 [Polyangiales bacterium]|nr:hypothetical protein [Polyangiales bacterium]
MFATDGVVLRCDGVQVESARALKGLAHDDADALAAELSKVKASAIAVYPERAGKGVEGRLARLEHVYGLRGALLAPRFALYVPTHEIQLSDRERQALAYVTRALFRGAREPNVASFPASLRRVERVEVMVMLSQHGEPRLWRSARGTSIARALLTAARVARERWREREQAMGGPLAQRLGELDVEVSLLSEDGVLLDTQRVFVDRAITQQHGVGFDHRTAWHYVLPDDVAKNKQGPFGALSQQLEAQGLPLSTLQAPDTRVYRFVSFPLGQSKAPFPPTASPDSR